MTLERFNTIVVGAGQAGLATGYHLARRGVPFVILDAHERVGDAWRRRWESLSLFTPARYDGLPGMPFPMAGRAFPTKNEMADSLQAYAARFALPVRTGVRVESLERQDDRFALNAGAQQFTADNVVVAMSVWQRARVPAFARELAPGITQLNAGEYRAPTQFGKGAVLVVGAGNSGAEIALDAARSGHATWLSGRHPGHLPFQIDGFAARLVLQRIILGFVFHHVLTIRNPLGRLVRKAALNQGMPWIRIKPRDLTAAGITRVPKMAGVRGGLPLLEGADRPLEVGTVVWCTGFDPGFSWIRLPVFDGGLPRERRGVVAEQPGLYFVGLPFIYSVSSAMVRGVGRDAEYVARHIAARARH